MSIAALSAELVRQVGDLWRPYMRVPDGFVVGRHRHHARILHPVNRWYGTPDPSVSWRTIADALGAALAADTLWADLSTGSDHDGWDGDPPQGGLPRLQAEAIVETLGAAASRCCFAVWDGWGDLDERHRDAPSIEQDELRYLMLEGLGDEAGASLGTDATRHRSANIWGPLDGAFVVTTSIDGHSSYIGASAQALDELAARGDLELLVPGNRER